MNTFSLKSRIMFGVYTIFLLKNLKRPMVLELVIFSFLFFILASMVSLNSIISNSPRNVEGFYNFIISAFIDAELSVKAMTLLMFSVVGVMFKDTAKYVYSGTNKLVSMVRA